MPIYRHSFREHKWLNVFVNFLRKLCSVCILSSYVNVTNQLNPLRLTFLNNRMLRAILLRALRLKFICTNSFAFSLSSNIGVISLRIALNRLRVFSPRVASYNLSNISVLLSCFSSCVSSCPVCLPVFSSSSLAASSSVGQGVSPISDDTLLSIISEAILRKFSSIALWSSSPKPLTAFGRVVCGIAM